VEHYQTRVLPGFAVHSEAESGEKTVRARAAAGQAQVKNVKLVRGPWIRAFLDELEGFPEGGHDDQVDAFAGGMKWLMERQWWKKKADDMPKTLQEMREKEFRKDLDKRIREYAREHRRGGHSPGML
jgi:phage terminase large subunit-like protein